MKVNDAIEMISDPFFDLEITTEAAYIAPHAGWGGDANLVRLYSAERLRELAARGKSEPSSRGEFSADHIVDASDIVLLIAMAANEQILNGEPVEEDRKKDLENYIEGLSSEQQERGRALVKAFRQHSEEFRQRQGNEKELELQIEGPHGVEKVKIPTPMVKHLRDNLEVNKVNELTLASNAIADKHAKKREALLDFSKEAYKEFDRHVVGFEKELERNQAEIQAVAERTDVFLRQVEAGREAHRKREAFIYEAQLREVEDAVRKMSNGVRVMLHNEIDKLKANNPSPNSIAGQQLTALKVASKQLELHNEFVHHADHRNIDNAFKRAANLKSIVQGLEDRLDQVGYPSKFKKVVMACKNALISLKSLFSNKYKPEVTMKKEDLKDLKHLTSHYHHHLEKLKPLVRHSRPEHDKSDKHKHK